MVVMVELLVGRVLSKKQLSEIPGVVDWAWRKGVELVGGYSLQVGGKNLVQDGVISEMDHHLILILAKVLNRTTLTGLPIKGWNRKLLVQFIFQYALREKGVGCFRGDGSVSAVIWHPCFFNSVLYKLFEILDTDELLGLPPRMIMSILRAGMGRTWPVIGLLRWSGGDCFAMPLDLRVLATCSLHISGLSDNGGGPRAFWQVVIWVRSWSFKHFISSHLWDVFSRSWSDRFRSRSNKACCFTIFSFMSANIWRSWAS